MGMFVWTDEKLDRKARYDAERNNYDPPWAWWPGREPVGTHIRDQYDRSFEYWKRRVKAQRSAR